MIHQRTFVVVGAILALSASLEAAVTVGYFTDVNTSSTGPAAPITANGFTPLQITDITAFVAAGNLAPGNLSTISILLIATTNNGPPSAALLAQSAALSNWVASGGVIAFHDRNVCLLGPATCTPLPGSAGIGFVRSLGVDVDVEPPGTLVTNGPFGCIGEGTLDNGTFSNNGFAAVATLPPGAVGILNNDTPGNEVAFSYRFGAGWVYYAAIGLNFYLDPANFATSPPGFRTIYAPNMVAYLACLASGSSGCSTGACQASALTASATGAPSLSEWGLGILAIMLMGCAAVMLRSGQAKGAR